MLTIPHRRVPRRTKRIQTSLLFCFGLFFVLLFVKQNDLPLNEDFPEKQKQTSFNNNVGHTDDVKLLIETDREPDQSRPSEALSVITTPSRLETVLAKYRVTKTIEEGTPPDFRNPVYDKETRELVKGISINSNDPVDLSLLLMARSGHRHRVTDLIGGVSLDPLSLRSRLISEAKVFAPFTREIKHISNRDYRENPVIVPNAQCTEIIPCKSQGYADASVTTHSMENVHCTQTDAFKLCASPELHSDVPLPYYSYHDFGIMKKSNIQKTMLGAAFISNCGFSKRNDMVTRLRLYTNNKIHSYGRCVNSNSPMPATGVGRDQEKLTVLEHFKFSLAFENSESKDYVTEKFFGSLCASSVPLVIGAPNIKFWAPDTTPYPYESYSLLASSDFGDDPQIIANLLLELDSDTEAYEGLLKWKTEGYSDDFKALADMMDVHSECRACILTGDDLRHSKGINQYDVSTLKTFVDFDFHQFHLFIRERGLYSFYRIGFEERPSMRKLIQTVLRVIEPKKKNLWVNNDDLRGKPTRIYAFYLPSRARLPVLSDLEISSLPNGVELEVIFV